MTEHKARYNQCIIMTKGVQFLMSGGRARTRAAPPAAAGERAGCRGRSVSLRSLGSPDRPDYSQIGPSSRQARPRRKQAANVVAPPLIYSSPRFCLVWFAETDGCFGPQHRSRCTLGSLRLRLLSRWRVLSVRALAWLSALIRPSNKPDSTTGLRDSE